LARAAHVETPAASTVDELVAQKRRLRAQIQGRFVASFPLYTESNLSGMAPRLGGAPIYWSYRRFDQKLFPPVERIHPALKGRVAFTLYANSGMAAISAALDAIDSVADEGTPLGMPLDAYFESLRATRRCTRLRVSIDSAPRGIHYVDSITTEDRTRFDARGLLAVLFDTTCYDAASPRIAVLVDRCAEARVPCLLLRSHLKLDCLGLEYARLGSITFVLPPKPAREQVLFVKRVRLAAQDRLALTGGTFLPEALFPLDDDAEAQALNRARNEAIFANHAWAGPRLKAECAPTGVTLPHHGCFVILRPVLDSIWAGGRYLKRLIAALQQNGLAAREAPSFGYDLIAGTLLRVPERRMSSIRVALPDWDASMIARSVEVIAAEAASWLPTRAP
jgi:hypothetical protein